MANPRKCPHCQIQLGQNYSFDENLNLICAKCGKVSFPATEEAEKIFNRPMPMPFDKQPVPQFNFKNKNNVKEVD